MIDVVDWETIFNESGADGTDAAILLTPSDYKPVPTKFLAAILNQ